jgi:uncharacterized cupredoxin-like copper-binding protein
MSQVSHFRWFALLGAILLAVGCWAAPAATPSGSAQTRINVTLTDALRIEPSNMTVPSSVPVTFVVTNSGATDHEFFLGDEEAQAEHEVEMQQMGGMTHDEPTGIGVEPGQTKELTFTFPAPGQTLAGCHLAGHYAGGMRAAITIN